MTGQLLLAIATDQLSAVVGFVFLAVIVLSVLALVVATIAGARAAGRAEQATATLVEQVSAIEERLAQLETRVPPGPSLDQSQPSQHEDGRPAIQ